MFDQPSVDDRDLDPRCHCGARAETGGVCEDCTAAALDRQASEAELAYHFGGWPQATAQPTTQHNPEA